MGKKLLSGLKALNVGKRLIVELISFLLVLLFTYASVSKLMEYGKFRWQLTESPWLHSIAGTIAWFIPTIEILLACMLAFERTRLLALQGSFVLMVVFTGYIAALLNFSEQIPCDCGGIIQQLGWTGHLILNISFTVLPAIAITLQNHNKL